MHNDRYIDQWHRTESPEIHPDIYDQLLFDKGGKTTERVKNSRFNKRISTRKRMKWDPLLRTHTKINGKYTRDLNIKVETIKFLE